MADADRTPADLGVRHTLGFVRGAMAPERARVLEIGCGNGVLARELMREAHEVIALDHDPACVAAAKRLGVDARVAHWPEGWSGDGTFDVVLFTRSLHHVDDLACALHAARAALSPSGMLVVEDFDHSAAVPHGAAWLHQARVLLIAAGVCSDADRPHEALRGDPVSAWRAHHDGHVHPWGAVLDAIRREFIVEPVAECPYLYRYLLDGLAADARGTEVAWALLDLERRAPRAWCPLVGRRAVGRPRPGS